MQPMESISSGKWGVIDGTQGKSLHDSLMAAEMRRTALTTEASQRRLMTIYQGYLLNSDIRTARGSGEPIPKLQEEVWTIRRSLIDEQEIAARAEKERLYGSLQVVVFPASPEPSI